LIATARATAPDDPLYVVAMGCVTNVASALLLAPEIVERIVVVWTSGYPSSAPHVNHAFNLEQDLLATQVLLNSGVPLVYLPGFQVGAQLRLSLPEVEWFVQARGAIGDYLHHLFTHNPLWDLAGIESLYAHSWVIWDVITLAWLMRPEWVPSELVRTPTIDADRIWRQAPGRPLMREAYAVARDAIFADFFRKLESAPA
ncbi:MAG TPA: nucleoside hydrolase, partial [Burkholderiaceae bacterium]|nr:nucleoside hydrolase [Burkholderiaceae bacterium]